MIVGITGAFGSGKSTVARFFKKVGFFVIDADKITHALYRKNKNLRGKLVNLFGADVIKNSSIDRRELAKIVFRDKKKLKKLCELVHPKVIEEIKKQCKKKKLVIVEAPLLIETGLAKIMDYIIVVKSSRNIRMARCIERGFTRKEFILREHNQMEPRKKLKYADFIINNDGDISGTEKQVLKIWSILNR